MAKQPLKADKVVGATRSTTISKLLLYKGMPMPKDFDKRVNETNKKLAIATASSRKTNSVELNRTVNFVNFTQPPYTDGDLGKMEAAGRKNLAVRTGITVRKQFAFGKGSKLIIELNESDKLDKDEGEQSQAIEKLTNQYIDLLKKIADLDEKVELVEHMTGPFYWQLMLFGRGAVVKIYEDEDLEAKEYIAIRKLIPINTRRLGLNILNNQNNMEFEGVYIDGNAIDRLSLIYGTFQDVQISPYTEHYGYSPIEPILTIAQAHNVATEEDIPEILKSAWLKAIMFIVNTAGLNSTEATAQIQTIIDAINPGKYVGVNTEVKEAIPLDLDPNYEGIMKMVDGMETKIFKTLGVPQFLVQSEAIANMATANKSAALFLDGPVAQDQLQMSNLLWKQWYEPLLRRELEKDKDEQVDDDPQKDFETLPFKIKRVWDKATVEEFIELSSALVSLVGSNIWDIEQANKILQTPEVAKRVAQVEKENKSNMEAGGFNPEANPDDKSSIGTPNNSPKPNVKTSSSDDVTAIRKKKLELLENLNIQIKANKKNASG